MRKLLLSTLALSAILALPIAAQAQTAPVATGGDFLDPLRTTLSLSGGTLGFGPELGFRYGDLPFGVRLSYNTFDLEHSFRERGTQFNGRVQTSTFGGTLDAYPFRTGFRLSAGFRAGDTDVRVNSRPAATLRIGDTTYAAADIGEVNGRASYNKFAPYVGLGYTTTVLNDRLSLSIDAGAVYVGKADVELRATGPLALVAARDIERERRDIEGRFGDYRFFPVVQLTVGYRF